MAGKDALMFGCSAWKLPSLGNSHKEASPTLAVTVTGDARPPCASAHENPLN
jgi:hypothetical protein